VGLWRRVRVWGLSPFREKSWDWGGTMLGRQKLLYIIPFVDILSKPRT
jgi:hypothetical protein